MRKLAEETGSGLGKDPGRSDTIQSRNVFNWGLNGPGGWEYVWKITQVRRPSNVTAMGPGQNPGRQEGDGGSKRA